MESIGVLRFNRHLNPNIAQKHAENCGKATISNSTVYKMQALRVIDHETEAVPRRRPLFDLLGDGEKKSRPKAKGPVGPLFALRAQGQSKRGLQTLI